MYDVILAGGGLANVLLALALQARQPQLRIVLLERESTLGGHHTWSFHETDLDRAQIARLKPFIVKSWPAQTVAFPGYQRRLAVPYHAISSARFHQVAMGQIGDRVRLCAPVEQVGAERVTLSTGKVLRARCVIDGRGPRPLHEFALAYQSFVGADLVMAAPHGIGVPVIMDATVTQLDGYRFVYLLPYDEHRLLVEDTYYTDEPALDVPALRRRIDDYVAARGWRVARELEVETGVLPLLLGGDIEAFWARAEGGPVPVGLRAGLFHPVTGYSLPDAMRLADVVSNAGALDTGTVRALVRQYALRRWRQQGFYCMLNRLLFLGAQGPSRRVIFERFYTLPEPLVQRFYAGHSSLADKAHILFGKPPIAVLAAMRAMPSRAAKSRDGGVCWPPEG
ncbi:MAG: lycopene beta-cyclase CrtY [Gammaproteobacteria bacterium]|nr:lycopene beta-cyclase CrtY [Gammaproteobacteria bacterium]